MKTITFLSMGLGLLCLTSLNAQQLWTLDSCLNYLMVHHDQLKAASLSISQQQLLVDEAKQQFMPELNFSGQTGLQFGRSIDPTTNSFENQTISFAGAAIEGQMTLYQGQQRIRQVAKKRADLRVAKANMNEIVHQLRREVMEAYFAAVLAKERLALHHTQYDFNQSRMSLLSILIEKGLKPKNEQYHYQVILADKEQEVTKANVECESAIWTLKQLLQMPDHQEMELVTPAFLMEEMQADQAVEDLLPLSQTTVWSPRIIREQAQVQAAEAQAEWNANRFKPQVQLFGRVQSNFSSAARKISDYEKVMVPQEAIWQGQKTVIELPVQRPLYESNPLLGQWAENFGQQLGIRVFVPLLNRNRVHIANSLADLSVRQARIALNQSQKDLKLELAQEELTLQFTRTLYAGVTKKVRALRKAVLQAQKDFELGELSALDYFEQQHKLEIAEHEQLTAKYQLLYQIELMNWYRTGL